MNAGPDVERAISAWLAEEAPAQAPDRVLDVAARTIDRTKQRRFAAAWREPMILSSSRLLGAAAVVLVAVVGAGVIGRMTASDAGGVLPSGPTATASASATASVTLESFRAARDAICTRYAAQANPMKPQFAGIYDAATPTAQRTSKIDALRQFLGIGQAMTDDLSRLVAPPEVAADHSADVAHYQDIDLLISQELHALGAGQLAQAQGIDQSIDPLAAQIGQFEQRYRLSGCP